MRGYVFIIMIVALASNISLGSGPGKERRERISRIESIVNTIDTLGNTRTMTNLESLRNRNKDELTIPSTATLDTIAEDETWSGEIHVSNSIMVLEGVTLTISPGTKVHVRMDTTWDARISFYIYGSIIAVGREGDRIEIKGEDPGTTSPGYFWGRLYITEEAVFEYCDISDGYDTITLWGSVDSLRISHCVFTNNRNYTIVFYNTNRLKSEISHNVFHDNHTCIGDNAGTYEGNEGNITTITRNVFYNNTNDAIRWGGTGEAIIINNTIISDNWAMLFYRLNTTASIVKNNIIYGQKYGICSVERPNLENVDTEFPQISYNDFYNCSDGAYVIDVDTSNAYDFQPFDPLPGVGEINQDPLFADYSGHDYHLSVNSPCIDAGDPDSPLDPDGSVADMGAYDSPYGSVFPNTAPSAFNLVFPYDNAIVSIDRYNVVTDTLTFLWEASQDPDGDEVVFTFDGISLLHLGETTFNMYQIPYSVVESYMHLENVEAVTGTWTIIASDGIATTKASNGPFTLTIDASTVGVEETDLIPEVFALHQNYPNPFNPITTLRFDLPERSDVTLTIYDILGREVITLVRSAEEPGLKSVIWDGIDDKGQSVSDGVYLYQVRAGDFTQTRKMLLLK